MAPDPGVEPVQFAGFIAVSTSAVVQLLAEAAAFGQPSQEALATLREVFAANASKAALDEIDARAERLAGGGCR